MLRVVTHNGPFHADDVLAFGLLRAFVDADATVVRSRSPEDWAAGDIVIDVGGTYAPEQGRFDHHQASYQGPLSSAGMVVRWLEHEGHITADLCDTLKKQVVDYVDDVDNGRLQPATGVPCFANQVQAFNHGNDTLDDFDAAFFQAAVFAERYVRGIEQGLRAIQAAHSKVEAAMQAAVASDSNVLALATYCKWKPAYFELGGADHPTEYALYPGMDGKWHVVAIPPALGDFAQKRSLPEEWAGLTGSSLEKATGVSGAKFCHKNRFIAVFITREGALEALENSGRRWRKKV
ncbi:MAG: MYG1 family protein [Proteobacteria bacterium]|nr:MYG1 family protein [Pseudomonadota bacterium]